jgi:hypothetical protein
MNVSNFIFKYLFNCRAKFFDPALFLVSRPAHRLPDGNAGTLHHRQADTRRVRSDRSPKG